MSVRRIPKSYRNVTGIIASRKALDPANFESTLERDLFTLLEFSPDVHSFDVQPVTIEWRHNGQLRHYTPDVLVNYRQENGETRVPQVIEVKYRSDLHEHWSELRPKLRAGVHYARTQGWRFKIMTEVEIRTPYLANAKFLQPFARVAREPEPGNLALLNNTIRDLRETSPEALLLAACQDEWNRAKLLPALWHLIGTFCIGADLHTPLTMTSRIWSTE
jgi:hypothetical protein